MIIIILAIIAFVLHSVDIKSCSNRRTIEGLSADEEKLIAGIENIAVPFNGEMSYLKDEDLEKLNFPDNAEIIGLGEAAYGAKEFLQAKLRIFQYLAQYKGFRILALQCSISEALYLEDYVIQNKGDLNDLMNSELIPWQFKNETFKQLLDWMKDFNKNKPDESKLHIMGFESRLSYYDVNWLKWYLLMVLPGLPQQMESLFESLGELNDNRNSYRDMSQKKMIEIKKKIETNIKELESQKEKIISNSGRTGFEIASQLLRTWLQSHEVNYSFHFDVIHFNRDRYMAENALWISRQFGLGAKTVLWGHNSHIANDEILIRNSSMGKYLKDQLKDHYYILGFGFTKGNFDAITPVGILDHCAITEEPRKDSINYILYYVKYKNFFISFQDLPRLSFLSTWLSNSHRFLQVGFKFDGTTADLYDAVPITTYFDGLIYLDLSNSNTKN